jgi:hypothetical protein
MVGRIERKGGGKYPGEKWAEKISHDPKKRRSLQGEGRGGERSE